ncbi:hypothetical protein [Bifidobacterium bombi]|uniref:Uncharacterized protein n=1 Tax=Bifidobacterium bombi DSM 19703 TaxID=1341695 RepID=A0A080N3E1_9BIFI|nr:hypothetical protein [Bifidobacterium bombi]KFF31673.1 hypothetical protein BBOMB_1060 [Bifidobacterium bombi DSM 19703]
MTSDVRSKLRVIAIGLMTCLALTGLVLLLAGAHEADGRLILAGYVCVIVACVGLSWIYAGEEDDVD